MNLQAQAAIRSKKLGVLIRDDAAGHHQHVDARLDESDGRAVLRFDVHEGAKTKIHAVAFEGNANYPDDRLGEHKLTEADLKGLAPKVTETWTICGPGAMYARMLVSPAHSSSAVDSLVLSRKLSR